MTQFRSARLTRLLVPFLFILSSCVFPSPSSPPALRFKFFVSKDGLHRLTGEALQSAGVDANTLDPATVQFFRGDREIAIRVQGEGRNLAIDFYGQASDSPYSALSVYWMRWGVESGKRMREISSAALARTPAQVFTDTLRLGESRLYIPQAGETDSPWFWQSLTAPMTTTIPIALPNAVPADARVKLNLWASTQDVAQPNHHLRVFFNNARVADEAWNGMGARTINAAVAGAAIRAGDNTIRLVAPGDTPAKADVVLLRSIEVTYSRRSVAQNDALQFQGDRGTYRVEGFSGDAIEVFDIGDPNEPLRVANAVVAARSITFANEGEPRKWLAIGPSAFETISRLAPMQMANLRATERRADYLILTHPDLIAALQPLAQWREQRGLKTMIVTTTEIYDEFGYGAESPLAIRAFLNWVQREWTRPAPRWVLLVGKASYDYRDYMNAPNKNLLPTFLVKTPHLGQAASDNWFVAESESDARPTLAIGRIPAKTPEQVARVVNKTIAYESGSFAETWRQRALFIADDKDSVFTQMADMLATRLPDGIVAQKTDLAQHHGNVETARAELLARWNAGVWLLAYIGHGSIDTWAAGPLLEKEHLAAIQNAQRLPILITPTCLDGYFYHPQMDSLAEALLFKGDGGIVAGFVPTGLSLAEAQSELMRAFFAELALQPAPTLGQAITQAKRQSSAAAPEMREVIETFSLLGDPALRVR